jgi:hypothetical protein
MRALIVRGDRNVQNVQIQYAGPNLSGGSQLHVS